MIRPRHELPLPRWAFGLASVLFLMLGLCNASLVNAEEGEIEPAFTVVSATSRIDDDVVRLDAVFELIFSEKLIEGLHSGVPLTLLVEMEVLRERSFWVSETVAEIEQRFQISFNPLTGKYLFHNLNSDARFQLPSFDVVKLVASHLSNFPLLDYTLLNEEEIYNARLRIKVDREKFPVPLRLMTYVTSDWDLVSEWFEWPLQ